MFCSRSHVVCLMVRYSIMLEKPLFVTKLLLDGWEKLLSEDVLVHSLYMTLFLGKIVSEPTPLAEKQPCMTQD